MPQRKNTRLQNLYNRAIQRLRNLHWIDIVGVSLFLAVITIAFFFLLRRSEYATITLRISNSDELDSTFSKPPTWYIEKIKPGVKEIDGLGRTSVEVIRVYKIQTSDSNQNVYADLKVKSVYNARTGQYTYNGSPLLIGSYQLFKLQGLQLFGIIVKNWSDEAPQEEKTYLVTGYLEPAINDIQPAVANTIVTGVKNHIANALGTGLKMTDTDGETVAEIVEIKKTEGRRRFISGSAFISVPDPERQEVQMKVKVKAIKVNDAYYFKGEIPMLINATYYLSFPTINVNLTSLQIEEVTE
jgi:hypothetical protein